MIYYHIKIQPSLNKTYLPKITAAWAISETLKAISLCWFYLLELGI
ncbi:hypothetical protein EBME_2392 [bacterium endosymbiont of Mortierella elongata FMR23-6]|nr:hypothetical protein EBME_2392 [bacterium endosymbiont of Mortierella elongata FMR23-6]